MMSKCGRKVRGGLGCRGKDKGQSRREAPRAYINPQGDIPSSKITIDGLVCKNLKRDVRV